MADRQDRAELSQVRIMNVIVMEVKEVEKHPNADALLRYTMQAPTHPNVQVIANQERVYAVGDRVIVALTGATLKDGTKISATKLRGLASHGIALGPTQDAVGADVSDEYCQPALSQSASMIRWPSIELFHNLRRSLEAIEATPQLTYRAKVKLDGTNAAVQVFADGRVAAQSRTQVITPEDDNMGFAGWLNGCQDAFSACARATHLTIFGEWCGKGIQKRAAISKIDRKVFVVFAVQLGGINGEAPHLEIDPQRIAAYLPEHPDIFVLPFYSDPIIIDFAEKASLEGAIARLSHLVEEVERVDPWVKDTFGFEGVGEGIVLYPDSNSLTDRLEYNELIFKAKGEKHQVVKSKEPVQLDPELVKSIDEFVAMFVTPNRLEQGLTEACGGKLEMPLVGAFLKWFATDVKKESVAELKVADLTWKEVNKAVSKAAKDWYLAKVKAS